ncbi:hypothetical protein [Xenorhabdus littoralis]|uniref:hypothetical protein n=1 Tax=Xenorhabdus littoralis TaxID=2582835 RepID=UPI0029E829F6|nr:hypothetical protein [Xenorhabdus sp. psl]MDX7991758.1 hypothetical protein [Xenorhabdus sp. psl]
MLLHSRNNNTLRLLERHYGAELRYNRQVFFANNDLARIIKFVIETSDCDYLPLCQQGLDEKIVRNTLHKLSEVGIPLSFWGAIWSDTEDSSAKRDGL